ncbi:tetratricopeptide repeat protein [Sphingobium sp. AN641]|uniref:tetratricopeptide repeat protein n=1 Tax=Sphingobium sp. AN641 TaxID=3133443 RepID=UPI0030BD3D87
MSRKRIILLAGLVALLLGVAAIWQTTLRLSDGRGAYARAISALDASDPRTARVELMNAIKADPRSPTIRIAQARALLALEDGEGAAVEIDRAIQLGAPRGGTRLLMAQAQLLQGDADAALRQLAAPDRQQDQPALAARLEGRAALMLGRLAQARAAFNRAQHLSPSDAETWVDIGRYYIAAGDQAAAIAAADRAVALAPSNVKALTLRAERTRDQYGLAAARPWFERALAIDPAAVPTLIEYAATLADMGEARHMLSVSRRILSLQPDNPRAWFMQAVLAARAGREDLARGLLARTEGRLDNQPATMLLRGVLHLAGGNGVLAAESLERLVALQPDNDQARLLLGRAYHGAGDQDAAAATLAPLVVRADADPYVLTLAARVQEARGDRSLAADMLNRAAWPARASTSPLGSDGRILAAGPPASAATAVDNIPYIRALLNDGQAGQAVDRALLLAAANPGAPAALIVLGDALDAAGRPAQAARRYETAANMRFSQDVAIRLAAAWQRAGDPARARQVLDLFLGQNPASLPAQRLAAALRLDAQDWRGARRMLEGVRARIGNQDAMLMADLARATLAMGDRPRALAYAAHAWRLMPASPMTADIYGWALTQAGGNGQRAVDLLEQARAMAPGHPVIQLHLGQAYAAMRRRSEARTALARAAAVPAFPGRAEAVAALAAL